MKAIAHRPEDLRRSGVERSSRGQYARYSVRGGLPFFLAMFIFVAAPKFFKQMFSYPPEVIGIPLGVILFIIAVMALGAGV